MSQVGEELLLTSRGEASRAAKHPPIHKTVPTKRIILPKISIVLPSKSPGFKSQQAEKLCDEREG